MGHTPDSWEDMYRASEVSKLPWYTTELDRDLQEAVQTFGPSRGVLLDLGTGPGTHAVGLAKLGYEVVASDISASAIRAAKHYAKQAGVSIEFRVDNILRSNLEDSSFDGVIDRGVFHTLPPENRPTYVATVDRILRPRAHLHLKCFSDKEPGDWGPFRLSRRELRSYFRERFEILSIAEAVFQGNVAPHPQALIASFRRK